MVLGLVVSSSFEASLDAEELRFVYCHDISADRSRDRSGLASRIIKEKPGIHKRLIIIEKIPDATIKPAANVAFRNRVAATTHSILDSLDREFDARQPEEDDVDSVSVILQPLEERKMPPA